MVIKIGDYSFDASLENNETTEMLLNLFPLKMNMSELNGNEKYFYLKTSLPSNPKRVGQICKGDIMLWGNDCLVIFYKSFSSGYSYTKIGHIENAETIEKALGQKSIDVTFSK